MGTETAKRRAKPSDTRLQRRLQQLEKLPFLAIEYGIDLEENLAQIVPPELKGEIDDGRDGAL